MQTKRACVMCGSDRLRLDESEKMVSLEGAEVKVPVRMHWCEACGSEMALNEDLRFNARAMRQVRKKHYGLLTGEQVRAVRKRLGLSQEQAAKIFGGGPVAFSKYENDEISQSEAMDRLIWLVGTFPHLLVALTRRANIELSFAPQIHIVKHRIKFDDLCFRLANKISEESLEAVRGYLKVNAASNDRIYHMARSSSPAKWRTA